jgi:hypothetical protein
MTFKVLDFHPEHKTYILLDKHDEVWWMREEKTKSGHIRYFTNYPDAYKPLMKANGLNAHSLRSTLNREAQQAIEKWNFTQQLNPETVTTLEDLINDL